MLSKFKTLLATSALAISIPAIASAHNPVVPCSTVVDSNGNPVRSQNDGYVLTQWSAKGGACNEATIVGKEHMVFFGFDDAHLKEKALQKVQRIYHDLSSSKAQVVITLVGNADYTGSDQYNMHLSRERAESVKKELVALGVHSNHITVIAKGYHNLLVPTEKGVKEPKNRRVDIYYAVEAK